MANQLEFELLPYLFIMNEKNIRAILFSTLLKKLYVFWFDF